jgi:mono/diheme cytochrome c family protein
MSLSRRVLLALPVALAACGDPTGVTSLTGDATAGKALYAANCQSCHGPSGTARANAAGEAKSDPAEAAAVILNGKEEMPAYASTLSHQQVADLLAYLKTL